MPEEPNFPADARGGSSSHSNPFEKNEMNKTCLAVLIGSLFVSAAPAFADDVVHLQNGALDAAVSEDSTSLELDVSSDDTIVMSADDGEEHVVSTADSITIHHDAPRNSGSFIAKIGSTLTLSATPLRFHSTTT